MDVTSLARSDPYILQSKVKRHHQHHDHEDNYSGSTMNYGGGESLDSSNVRKGRHCNVLKRRCRQSFYVNPWNIAKGCLDVGLETEVAEDHITRPYDYYGVLDLAYFGCAKTLLEKTINCPIRFNPFALDRFTSQPVMFFGMFLFEKCGFFKCFGCQPPLLEPIDAMKILRDIEENYHYKNTYHNQLHTVDVTQSFYVLMNSHGFREKFQLSDIETMIALFAALCHDIDHPGNTSKYVCLFKHAFFFRYYNEKFRELRQSEKVIEFTLENHHAAMATSLLLTYKVLKKAGCTLEEQEQLFNLLSDLINATDMERHKSLVEKFQTHLIRVNNNERCTDNFMQTIKTDALQLLIKCADISNPFREWNIAATWATLVCEEFYQQNDKELLVKRHFMSEQDILGLPPVTGACERTKQIAAVQIGFISFVVEPLVSTFSKLDGTSKSHRIVAMVQKNLRRWKMAQQLHTAGGIQSIIDACPRQQNSRLSRVINGTFVENKKITVVIRTA